MSRRRRRSAQGQPPPGSVNQEASVGAMHVTPRQEEILTLVAAGFSDKEIALELGLSPRTVQTHLDRLFLEHGLHKRSAAVAAWLRRLRT